MSFNELSYPFEIELRDVKYESLLDSLVKLGYPKMENQLVKNLIAKKYLTSGKIPHLYSFSGLEDKSHEIANEVEKLIYEAQEKAWDYPSIVADEVSKDLLSSEVVIQEKLDGANMQFLITNGKLRTRTRHLELEGNVAKLYVPFVELAKSKEMLVREKGYEHYSFYGEYMNNHIIKYKDGVNRTWFLFDILDRTTGMFLAYDEVVRISKELDLKMPKELYRGPLTVDLSKYVGLSDLAIAKGEGIVVKKTAARNRSSSSQVKVVLAEFKEKLMKKVQGEKVDPLEGLLDSVVIKQRVMKVLHKKQDEGKLERVLTGKDIGTVLKEVNQAIYEDVIEEEWKAIEKLLKKKIQSRAGKLVSQLVLTGEVNRDEESEEIEENE